jgi:hypothetical protein
MLKFFKQDKKEGTYKMVDGKVVLVKEWPSNKPIDNSWGRSGYDSLYK